MTSLSLKAYRFLEANATSLVVYGGVGEHTCTYRLEDGTSWTLSRREAREIGHPRWAHIEQARAKKHLGQHRKEEMNLLARLEREARMRSDLA